jgi:hypothetical protein
MHGVIGQIDRALRHAVDGLTTRLSQGEPVDALPTLAVGPSMAALATKEGVRMELYPRELGRIEVRIRDTEEGISVSLVCSHEVTRQLVQDTAAELRQSLHDSGLSLSQFDVTSDNTRENTGQFEPPTRQRVGVPPEHSLGPETKLATNSNRGAGHRIDVLA